MRTPQIVPSHGYAGDCRKYYIFAVFVLSLCTLKSDFPKFKSKTQREPPLKLEFQLEKSKHFFLALFITKVAALVLVNYLQQG